jgi:uncharacterized protein (TIGR04255 family)
MANASVSENDFKLKNAPIVEVVLDIDCDMPPGQELASLESRAQTLFREHYPKFQTQFLQEHEILTKPDSPATVSTRHAIQAFQFRQHDEKQLVQVRRQGFSFNRLSPYSTLKDYLPEIRRTWELFVDLVSPIQIRLIRLRHINRISLPMVSGNVDLDDYLKRGPRSPDEERLRITAFLNQQIAIEPETGNQIALVLTAQPPESDKLPVILDIAGFRTGVLEPGGWNDIVARIHSLRGLNERVFLNMLTQKCFELFQD